MFDGSVKEIPDKFPRISNDLESPTTFRRSPGKLFEIKNKASNEASNKALSKASNKASNTAFNKALNMASKD